MIYRIKQLLTEDSELMQSVRDELENSLSSANARGIEIQQLTKTPSPHISDKEDEPIEESHKHKDSPIDEHKEFLKKLRKIQLANSIDNPATLGSSIFESIVLKKQEYLNSGTTINKSAANELSKEGLANVDRGSKAVANSFINNIKHGANAATGTITESDTNFGKVHSKSTEGTNLIQNTSTQAAIDEKGKMERSINKKITAGVTIANPSNAINNRNKDGIAALLNIQKNRN